MSLQAGSGYAARSGVLRLARRWNASTRLVAVSVSVLFLASLRIPGRPPTLCLLRATTGIPCPFCGGTTAGVDLGHGDPVAALRASPLAVIGGVLFVLTPVIRRSRLAKRWHMLPFRLRRMITTAAIITALAISEAWQLARFGLL